MRKIILIIILAAILIITGLIFYLNKVYLPVKAKAIVIEQLEKFSNCKVQLDKISIDLIKGISLSNISFHNKTSASSSELLSVDNISFHILILPIFKEKKIIIPSINIRSPKINLILNENKELDIPAISFDKKDAKQSFNFQIIVTKLSINNGSLNFTDKSQAPIFLEKLDNINIDITPSIDKPIKLKAKANIENGKKSPASIDMNGNFNPFKKNLGLEILVKDLALERYNHYLLGKLNINSALIKNAEINLGYNLGSSDIELKLGSVINQADLLKDKINIKGDARISLSAEYNYNNKKINSLKGSLNPVNLRLENIPFVQEISGINGRIEFSESLVRTKELIGIIKNTRLSLTGIIEDFKDPLLSFQVSSDNLNLADLKQLFNEKLAFLEMAGESNLILKYEQRLSKPDSLRLEGEVFIKRADLEFKDSKTSLSNISGSLSFTENSLKWENGSLSFKDKKYASSGTLKDYITPEIILNITGDNLDLNSSFKVIENVIQLSQLEAKLLNSKLSLNGLVNLSKTNSPFINISGDIDLNLEDLQGLLPDNAQLKQLKPTGISKINLKAQGDVKDFKDLNLEIDASSDALQISGLKFNATTLKYIQAQKLLKDFLLKANGYNGTINIHANADLNPEIIPYRLTSQIQDIDLYLLKSDLALKQDKLSGILNLNMELNGKGVKKEDLNNLIGQGSFTIRDGYLWGFNPLKELANYIKIISFEDIVIKDASCDFNIKDKNFITDNLKLKSDVLNLDISGKISFDQELNLMARTQILDPDLVRERDFLSAIASTIVGQFGQFFDVNITGTSKEPKYKLIPAPIEKGIGIIKTLEDLF